MVKVTFLTNSGNGTPQQLNVVENCSWGDLLTAHWDGNNSEDFRFTVRDQDGNSYTLGDDMHSFDDEVAPNSRLTVVPRKVEGQ